MEATAIRTVARYACEPCHARYLLTGSVTRVYSDLFSLQELHKDCR